MISKDVDRVISEAIRAVRPSKDEESKVNRKIAAFLKKLNKNLKRIKAKAILGGSGAKRTWLAGTLDADIFVKFDHKKYSNQSSKLSNILGKALKKIVGRVSKLHGSRDYFQVKKNNFTFEIIPILDIKKSEQAKNITDVSPLHALWVLSKIKKKGKLADEIRLTKAFCKSIGVYGAESYINGFSGYVCEVLTIFFGSFKKLAIAASEWTVPKESIDKVVIDPKKYYRGKSAVAELNKSKIIGPLVIVDPVQKDRNAAASLSLENYIEFRDKCHEFLRKPAVDFFNPKKETMNEINSLLKNYPDSTLIKIEVVGKKGKSDVIGCQIRKVFDLLVYELENNEFTVFTKGWDFDKKNQAMLWFIVDKSELPKMKVHPGPPLKMKQSVEAFRKKHKVTFVDKGIVNAEVPREFTRAIDLVNELVKSRGVKQKIKKITLQ